MQNIVQAKEVSLTHVLHENLLISNDDKCEAEKVFIELKIAKKRSGMFQVNDPVRWMMGFNEKFILFSVVVRDLVGTK